MKRMHRSLLLKLMMFSLLACVPFLSQPAWSQDGEAVEPEVIPLGISPLSNRTALLSFPLSVFPFNEANTFPVIRFQELEQITVVFEDKTDGGVGLDINEDFLPLSSSALNSGLALFKESESKRGFNFAVNDQSKDLPIDLLEKPIVEKDPIIPGRFMVTFRPIPGSANVQLPFFRDQFADFYIVARTSLDLRQGDRFEIYIPANGIKIRDLRQNLPKDTLYEDRYPGDSFANLNPLFAVPAIFEGDIIQIVNLITDAEGKNRIDASSEPTSVLGLDMVGREDEGYFVEEVRVNWLGVNLGAISRLIANLSQAGYFTSLAGSTASAQIGLGAQVIIEDQPTFFYSPWFYNAPFDAETGEALTTVAPGDGETIIPLTMPLDLFGFPQRAFIIGADDPRNHFTSYVSYGPRAAGASGLTPRVITQDIFKSLRSDAEGGIFLFRELGGVRGKFDQGVDHLINLDADQFRVESFEINPEEAADPASPLYNLMRRLIPGQVGFDSAKDAIPILFGDDNLATLLMGVTEMPEASEDPRPPFGTLECTEDPNCYFFDLMINVLRPYLGLTEGQIRYLFEYSEGNGRTNSEDLFDFNLLQGFTFVLPVAKTNAISDLQAPTSRTGSDAGSDIFIAVQTSDNLRSLDAFIPFIRPEDIKVANNVQGFSEGDLDNVQSLRSVSSIGYGRQNTSTTFSFIGRPKPRFIYEDLTQPGEGERAGNNNILFDSSQSSPPKAVIGIDAQDFGQNPHLVSNEDTINLGLFDRFFTENTVFGEMQIDFVPGTRSVVFNPLVFNILNLTIGLDVNFSRVVSPESVVIYYDDDTPSGDGMDNDGDGLIDEEWYNLQDDDGDFLIDEDLGDNTPAGLNGVFDSMDSYLPPNFDRFGAITTSYTFQPNEVAKFQDYIDAIQPPDNPFTLTDGDYLPLNIGEGSFFAELDMRVLNAEQYSVPRALIYPPQGFIPFGSTYNLGTFVTLEPRMGLLDLIPMVRAAGGDFEVFPYYPDDLFIETADTGEIIWMVVLTAEGQDNIAVIPDPDGDVRKTFALSMNGGLRVPNPERGFVRVGWTPMVTQVSEVGGQNVSDPQGENLDDDEQPYDQFGIQIELADLGAINDYVNDTLVETLSNAYEQARDSIDEYNTGVEDAIAAAQDVGPDEEPGEPEFPEPPEPQEVSISSPFQSLNINQFLDGGAYDTNYQFQLQIPDENFGPLSGNDFYVVLRSSPLAQVGESFRVRIRSGQRNATIQVTDPNDGTVTTAFRPEGGIAYTSFIETDYGQTFDAFRNVSKNQITTDEIVVQSLNVSPSLTFNSPGSGINVADNKFEFQIAFTADDPDDVAEIQLFIDTDSLNFDGQFIPGAILREGFDTAFTLNLLEDVQDFDPTQKYFIYARLDDRVNAPVFVYADGPITTVAGVDTGGGTGGGGTGGGGSGRIVEGDLDNPVDYVKLRNDGLSFSLGDVPALTRIQSTTRIVDMEVTPNFSGQIAVQVDGAVIGAGDLGSIFARTLQPNGSFVFPEGQVVFLKNTLAGSFLIKDPTEDQITIESARDVEVDWSKGAIYVLDGDGDMLFLGNANTNLRPQPLGIDLYRDMELAPTGNQMYFLSGNGMLTSAGASSIGNLGELVAEDIYRDMDLRTRGGAVTNIVVTDANGNITVLGTDNEFMKTVSALVPEEPIPAGTIRQVKTLPDRDDTILLVEGSGKVHFLTKAEQLVVPNDVLIFSDQPGLDDDRIVDVETTAVNLQSVVESVRDIIDAFNEESVERIMAYVSPDYFDRSGADATGLRQSLKTFFETYEVQNFAESVAVPNSFILTNQGDTINAQVATDMSVWFPMVFFESPDIDQSSVTGETIAQLLFTDNVPTFDQTITLREVSDGRGWVVDLYEIRNMGRQVQDLITSDQLEFQDMSFLLGLPRNRRITTYVPIKQGVDDTILINLDLNENDPLEPFNIMAIFRESFLTRETQPPIFEYTLFTGSFLSALNFNDVNFIFKREDDGSVKLTSMDMRQILTTNDSEFITVDQTNQQNPLSNLQDQEIQQPVGFSLSKRGPIKAIFNRDADIVLPDNQTFQASTPLGGIMMLPENTNIFSINPEVLIGQTITRTTVRFNPFDPNQANLAGTAPGFQASLVPGRAYFVIAADGIHYGFIQVPEDFVVDQGNQQITTLIFDYRFEDSFVLPPDF